jgi:SAM-dependent methyltransferase
VEIIFTIKYLLNKDFVLVRCSVCDLVFVSNPPSADELTELYSFKTGYHSGYASDYGDRSWENQRARTHPDDIRRYKERPGRLLDIGCSAGFFLAAARDAGWEVCGVELSEDTAAIARRRFGLDITTGVLADDLFPTRSFDVVTLWDVVEHLPDPISVLTVAQRVLKNDGILLIETPNIDGLFPRMSYKVANMLNYWPHPEPPFHLFQFSKKTARLLLERVGLKTIDTVDRHIPLFYSFGWFSGLVHSPKRLAYAMAFAPLAALGPVLRQGDALMVAAAKS